MGIDRLVFGTAFCRDSRQLRECNLSVLHVNKYQRTEDFLPMLGLIKLQGTPEKQIHLETRKGTRIANYQQLAAPSPRIVKTFELLLKKHPSWVVQKPPTGIYNCCG